MDMDSELLTFRQDRKKLIEKEYNQLIRLGFLIGMSIIIFMMHIFPKMKYHNFVMNDTVYTIEVIDIPDINQLNEPPPPLIKTEVIAETPKIIESDVDVTEKDDFRTQIKEEDITLDIAPISSNLFTNNSQLSEINRVKFKLRERNTSRISNSAFNTNDISSISSNKVNFDVSSTSETKHHLKLAEFKTNTSLSLSKKSFDNS